MSGVLGRVVLGAVLGAVLGGCGGGGSDDAAACEGTGRAYVRNATLALLGRHPLSQGEVEAHADLYAEASSTPESGPAHAREVVARAIMASPEFSARWQHHLMDAMKVDRVDEQHLAPCYGERIRPDDQGELAAHVRDTIARANTGDGAGPFTMRDLLASSIALDDLSPLYRAHLLSLMARPIAAANLFPVEAELARRGDLGARFDSVYLNRDLACLGCHNSKNAVTYADDADSNRHWPLPGFFEEALYGRSSGIAPARAHAIFRVEGFAKAVTEAAEGEQPWQWAIACGGFTPNFLQPDIAGVDGRFGRFTGAMSTVYDLEAAIQNGVDGLAETGLLKEGNVIIDPDQAIAYLLAASVVEVVWKEVVGSPLTIANHFPRNRASRDVLAELTERFVASHFSLKELLVGIVTGPYFSLAAPVMGCGEEPYALPPIFDPWVIGDDDPALRKNNPGDGVFALSSRTAAHAADRALLWEASPFAEFPGTRCGGANCQNLAEFCGFDPSCCGEYEELCGEGRVNPIAEEYQFQQGTGFFHTTMRQGFRGLGFQARLVWEARYGGCAMPAGQSSDFVTELLARAVAEGAPVRDVVLALYDRLEGAPEVHDDERAMVEELLGAGLDDVAASTLEPGLRRLCGVEMAGPAFLLGGLALDTQYPIPKLTPPEMTYGAVCLDLASRGVAGVAGVAIECRDERVKLASP